MKFISAILGVMILASFACNKKDNNGTVTYYKAEVINTNDISCSRPLISIDPTDTAAVRAITGISSQLYVASQLPAALNTVGQKLNITIAKFGAGEDFTCNGIGVSYFHIKVVTAISRN
jgi:hypothetical protein